MALSRRIVILMAFFAFAVACSSRHGWAQSNTGPIKVQGGPVKLATVHPVLIATGTLISPEETKIVSPVGGRLVSLHFAPGQSVKKGAVLARLRANEAHAALQSAEAALANAKQVFLRDEKLLPFGGVSTEKSLNDASLLDEAEARVTQARERLAETEIKAPYSGVLGFRDVAAGVFLSAGEPITDIRKMNPLLLQIALPQTESNQIRKGLSVKIAVPGVCGTLSGRVTAIGPSLDSLQHSLRVQVQINNSDGRLKPGMFATARILLAGARREILIPEQAVMPLEGKSFVWVVTADKSVRRVAVTLGAYRNGQVEVLKGLQPSFTVVTAGMQKLHEGSKVDVDGYQPIDNPDLHHSSAGCATEH